MIPLLLPTTPLYRLRLWLAGLLWLAFCTLANAQSTQQSRQTLESQKRQNVAKINQLRQALRKTSTEKSASLNQVKLLSSQIDAQTDQIELLNRDIKLTDREIGELREAGNQLTRDLTKLKREYAAMIYAADKRRQHVNPLGFLFASENFNQLVARYRYLKQYSDARHSQVRQMNVIQADIAAKQQITQRKQNEQKGTLQTKVGETQKLEKLKQDKNNVVQALGQKETELRAELKESQEAVAQLESMIRRIVAREAKERAERAARARAERERIARLERERRAAERRRAEEAARAAEATGQKPDPAVVAELKKPEEPEPTAPANDERLNNNLNSEETALASSFAASRSRLPWPVAHGFISDRFGRRPHAVLKGVFVENQGIDIQTNASEPVRAIYDGIVQDVTNMPGMNNVVAVQHGTYFTIYAKLKNVMVSVGQRVKARQQIGSVATDKNGVSEIQFQIWKEFTKLNPESWLIPH